MVLLTIQGSDLSIFLKYLKRCVINCCWRGCIFLIRVYNHETPMIRKTQTSMNTFANATHGTRVSVRVKEMKNERMKNEELLVES